jgi:hypothetical protein
VRNEEECVCNVCLFHCNSFIGVRIIKEMLGLAASGTPCSLYLYWGLIQKMSELNVYLKLNHAVQGCG